jgi:hypothetical protein
MLAIKSAGATAPKSVFRRAFVKPTITVNVLRLGMRMSDAWEDPTSPLWLRPVRVSRRVDHLQAERNIGRGQPWPREAPHETRDPNTLCKPQGAHCSWRYVAMSSMVVELGFWEVPCRGFGADSLGHHVLRFQEPPPLQTKLYVADRRAGTQH